MDRIQRAVLALWRQTVLPDGPKQWLDQRGPGTLGRKADKHDRVDLPRAATLIARAIRQCSWRFAERMLLLLLGQQRQCWRLGGAAAHAPLLSCMAHQMSTHEAL